MGIEAETLAALVVKWIIANEDNGANQSSEQRRLVQHIRRLAGKLDGTRGFVEARQS
jgi:hypothetical protein